MRIARFIVRCRAPRRVRVRAEAVDRAVRGAVVPALGRRMAGWSEVPGVVRIRQLRVQLRLSVHELAGGRFGDALAAAILAALGAALRGEAGEIIRAPDRGRWLARFIADWIGGRGEEGWAYAEFAALRASPPGAALIRLAENESPALAAALAELQAQGRLARIMAACSGAELIRLGAALSPTYGEQPTPRDLLPLAAWMAGAGASALMEAGARLATAAPALAFWLAEPAARRFTIAQIQDGLRALEILCAHVASHPWGEPPGPPVHSGGSHPPIATDLESATPRITGRALRFRPLILPLHLPDSITAWLRGVFASETQAHDPEFIRLLATLAERHPSTAQPTSPPSVPAIPSPPPPPIPATVPAWQETSAAGLLMLVAIIERLDWRARALALPGGAEAWPFVCAGLAQTTLGRPPAPRDRLDPAVAIFAGWFGEPESAALLRFVGAPPGGGPSRFVAALEVVAETPPRIWADAFQVLAAALLRAFADRLPGFSASSRPFLLKNFIELPGRLLVEENRVRVKIDFAPHWPVLRLAGADRPVEAPSWFGGRRLDIQLADE